MGRGMVGGECNCELPRTPLLETVRKASDALAAQHCKPPKRGFSVHLALRIPFKFTIGALLVPLFGQFLEEVFSEVRWEE